jgi:hypothetical protein
MFFTRNVQHKLQQDTYIQRARMFGARGNSLKHFELTIPAQLYADWHKCFVYHKLSLATIDNNVGVPVWIGDSRVSVASPSSINNAKVTLDKGEMSFAKFSFSNSLDKIVSENPTSIETLKKLQAKIGEEALPSFVIEFIETSLANAPGSLAIHEASSIAGYGSSADKQSISRKKGFMGKPQLEAVKFPNAMHHVKIFHNGSLGKARVFYKVGGGVQFMEHQA